MHESDILVTDDLDLINQPKPTQIIPQHLLRNTFVQPTQIHISARITLLNSQCHCTRHRTGLSPTNLELLPMQRDFLDQRIRMERRRRRPVQEGQKDARLFGQDADRLEGAEMDEVEQFINGRGRGEVANVDGTSRRVVLCGKCSGGAEGCGGVG